jgi:phosphatidylserine/phosphatidylglycerophosphate/cardiolipin synthase-like enzyme
MSIEVRCGSNLRDFVLERLYSSRRVVVVSPWISRETASILLELASRGVEVSLITTSDPKPYHVKGLTALIEVEKVAKRTGDPRLARLGLSLLALGSLLSLLSALLSGALGGGVLAVVVVVGVATALTGLYVLLKYRVRTVLVEHYYSKIKELLVTSSRLHAKLILTDDAVGIGSLNFTEAGLSSNIECFAWISDLRVHRQVTRDLSALRDLLERSAVDYSSLYAAVKRK